MKGIKWLVIGTATAVALVAGALYYQGVFQGYFIKGYMPAEGELRSVVMDREGKEFVFDHIAFHQYDNITNRELSFNVPLDTYREVLDILSGSAKVEFTQHLLSKFEAINKTELVIYFKPKGETDSLLRVPYQRIQFIKNSGYFRVERLEKEGPYVWEYFQMTMGDYLNMVDLIEQGRPISQSSYQYAPARKRLRMTPSG